LNEGANTILFSASYLTPTGLVTVASDNPNDPAYNPLLGNSWTNGSDGGFGFGPWELETVGPEAALFRTDEWASTNMQVGTFNGFAFEAGPLSSAVARRSFDVPMSAAGGVFTVQLDSHNVASGGSVGLALADADGVERFRFYVAGDDGPGYRVVDAAGDRAAGFDYTQSGLPLRFKTTGDGRYEFTAGTNGPIVGDLVTGGPVSALVASNSAAGVGMDSRMYLGRLLVEGESFAPETVAVVAPEVVRVAAGGDYDQWAASYGLDPATDGAPGADPDNDGFTNAMEFAFGTDPTSPTATLLQTSQDGDQWTVSYLRRLSGVAYEVQQTGNLSAQPWAAAALTPNRSENQDGVPAGYERVEFRVELSGKGFYRIVATVGGS
jgi:hypothetical protein